ncbi:MAG: peptide-methionine (S)-S-oxide reductase MsrA [Zavarzinella sp.]
MSGQKTITLGGGCFWCIEAVFELMPGVDQVVSGYMGGSLRNPSYREVCTGSTGHAEVVQLTFRPELSTLEDILDVFFLIHDPTTLNQQGYDVGTQYRSVIFYHDEEQHTQVRAYMDRMIASNQFAKPIVTEVAAAEIFYPAENYHQSYFRNNSEQPYCQAVVAPKVMKYLTKYGTRS